MMLALGAARDVAQTGLDSRVDAPADEQLAIIDAATVESPK
jgi:hypothetical protein